MESESLESKETARKKIVTDYFSYPITLAEIFKNDKEGYAYQIYPQSASLTTPTLTW